jgi:anti-sigma B factor antagonist
VADVDQPLGITIESLAPDTVCVELSGELDFSRAYTFDEEMRRLEMQKPSSIVLDLRKLNFLDSAGLGRVLAVQRRASRDGRRLVVVRGSRAVERLFALSALNLRLEMVSEPRAALRGSTA